MTGIYKITSPTNRIYIGQSINIKARFSSYRSIKGSRYQLKLNKSFAKYGIDAHKFEIVIECEVDRLNSLERYYQDLYSCCGKHGLNCRLTGYSDRCGTLSQETKDKMSKAKKGRVFSEQHRMALKGSNCGRGKSPETIEKFRKAMQGKKQAKEHIEKRVKSFRDALTGKDIIQLNKKMEIVATYFNAREAARINNYKATSCIYQVANGKRSSAYNYIWKWKDEVA